MVPEESETVQTALKRLPPKEAYDRIFRIRRAFQVGFIKDIRRRNNWLRLFFFNSALFRTRFSLSRSTPSLAR